MRKLGKLMGRAALAGFLAGFAAAAQSQEFPVKPMRVIVPYATSGTPDVVARFLGQQMSVTLGQPVNVENRPGAGGLPAVQELIRSAPDGYTMLIGDVGQYAILPALRPGSYDPVNDWRTLGQITINAVFVMVNNQIPAKTMPEFIALVKSRPGHYSYGSAGVGTVHHLFMEAIKVAYGLDMVHVPFKGSSQTVPAMLNGDIPICICGVTTTQQFIKEGKLRVLAASTKGRDKLAPDVPSASEFGNPDLDFASTQGYFVPAATPRPIMDKLAAALAKAAQSPEFLAREVQLGTVVAYLAPEPFAEYVRASYARYQRVIKAAGIKTE